MMSWNHHTLGQHHGPVSLGSAGVNAAAMPGNIRSLPQLPLTGLHRTASAPASNHFNSIFASSLSNDLSSVAGRSTSTAATDTTVTLDMSSSSVFDFNKGDVLMAMDDEDLKAARNDNAEQLSKDIDDFLRSVREGGSGGANTPAPAPSADEAKS